MILPDGVSRKDGVSIMRAGLIKKESTMEWIWDVDKNSKRSKSWLYTIRCWYIILRDNDKCSAVAQGNKGEMKLFSGTEKECQDYVDSQT